MRFTPEQIDQVLSILAPEQRAREAEKLYVSDEDREDFSPDLIKVAESLSPRWLESDFSPRKWKRAAKEAVRTLREANPSSAFAFLLRKGIQQFANKWYVQAPAEWEQYCHVAQSTGYAEWMAPMYGSGPAGRVKRGDKFKEGRVVAEDSALVNQLFGKIESFDRTFFDDDQTGQIRDRASRLGESMRTTENFYASQRFIGTAGSLGDDLSVDASNYTTTNVNGGAVTGPWSATLYGTTGGVTNTGYGNRPSAYGPLGLNLLKQGWSDGLNAKDPLGVKLVVSFDTLIVSPMDALHGPMLVSPPQGVPYYPSVPGQAGQDAASATSGFPGGAFGANPFMGLGIKVVMLRYLIEWAWALMQRGKGFVFQERDPLEVVQEAVNAGSSFETDAYRFRSRRRAEVDWVGGGSRFAWLGNDGTVLGSF